LKNPHPSIRHALDDEDCVGHHARMKAVFKTYKSANGVRMVEVYDHQDGFFSFEESCEAIEDIPDLGPETYWMITYVSGLFDSAEAAERDAQLAIPWLRTAP